GKPLLRKSPIIRDNSPAGEKLNHGRKNPTSTSVAPISTSRLLAVRGARTEALAGALAPSALSSSVLSSAVIFPASSIAITFSRSGESVSRDGLTAGGCSVLSKGQAASAPTSRTIKRP